MAARLKRLVLDAPLDYPPAKYVHGVSRGRDGKLPAERPDNEKVASPDRLAHKKQKSVASNPTGDNLVRKMTGVTVDGNGVWSASEYRLERGVHELKYLDEKACSSRYAMPRKYMMIRRRETMASL